MIVNAGSDYPNAGGSYGSINLSGSGTYSLTPILSGTYAGILFFHTSDNSQAITVSGAASGMSGTIYAPSALLSVSGTGQIGTGLVVDRLAALRLARRLDEGLAVFPFAARYQPHVKQEVLG